MEWREVTEKLQVFFVCTIVTPSPCGLKSAPELVFSSPGTYVSYHARYLVQRGRGVTAHKRKHSVVQEVGVGPGPGNDSYDKYDDFGDKSSLTLHSHPRKSRHEQNSHGCLFTLERFQGEVFINNN